MFEASMMLHITQFISIFRDGNTMSLCNRNNCVDCCLHADVPLLNEDINRIIMYGYYDAYFVQEVDGVKMIRTERDGRCIFYTQQSGLCDVYASRPERCKLLPYTVDDSGCRGVVDHQCPNCHEMDADPKTARRMENFVAKLQKEIKWRRETHHF